MNGSMKTIFEEGSIIDLGVLGKTQMAFNAIVCRVFLRWRSIAIVTNPSMLTKETAFMTTPSFPDLSQLSAIQRINKLDMQSSFSSYQAFDRLREFAKPISTQFHAISGAIGQLVSIRPTFFLASKVEEAKLQKLNYLAVADFHAQVPEGFNARMVEYLAVLEECAVHSQDLLTRLVNPFVTFLEDISTNKASMASVTRYANAQKMTSNERDKLNAAMGKCFKVGSHATSAKLSSIFVSKAEYIQAVDASECLSVWLTKTDDKKLQAGVDRACVLLDRIADDVGEGKIVEASKTNLTHLADCAYELGREVEFYALLVYRIHAVSASMNNAAEKLRNAAR